jgi:hypothetical protein
MLLFPVEIALPTRIIRFPHGHGQDGLEESILGWCSGNGNQGFWHSSNGNKDFWHLFHIFEVCRWVARMKMVNIILLLSVARPSKFHGRERALKNCEIETMPKTEVQLGIPGGLPISDI